MVQRTDPREMKTSVHIKTCMQIFIVAGFITIQTWKQPKCPSTGKWMNKLCYILRILFNSKNKLLIHATTPMNLKILKMTESQTKKT